MDDNSDYVEVSPNEILHRASRFQGVIKDPKIQNLPLKELPWDDFEEMALRLFSQELESTSGLKAFRYGGIGHKQHGLDLIALNPGSEKFIVAECKRVSSLSANTMSHWIERFLSGEKAEKAEKFILITTFSISSKPELVDQWHQLSLLLKKQGIEPDLWDFNILTNMLRHSHKTVEIFYGFTTAERFCLRSSGSTKYPVSYEEKKIYDLGRMKSLKNRTIQLDMFLPTEEEPHLSGGFSFARADLNGFSIAVESRFLIDLMQHRAHASSINDNPNLYSTDNNDQYVFALPYARFILEKNEMEDLDWIIKKAWHLYINAVLALEKNGGQ
jgi:hypothetical protein